MMFECRRMDEGKTSRQTEVVAGLALLFLLLTTPLHAIELDATRYYLGTSGFPEWQEFAGKIPHGRRLDLRFQSHANTSEQSLFIRQRDVKQRWQVQLNGRRIGDLVTVETELVNGWAVPPGVLKEGENTLS